MSGDSGRRPGIRNGMVSAMHDEGRSEARAAAIWRLLLAAAALVWLGAVWRIVALPEDALTGDVLVDDAFYFALPARHWWQGLGFSFDGHEASNGVQALWAFVVLALAGVISEPLALLRAMVLTSALCWGAAALGVFALLRRRSRAAGLLAACGMAWAGVHGRLALSGMENGLLALVTVLVLLAGERAVERGWTRRHALTLGLCLALFALCRTEGVLLALLAGAALAVGVFDGTRPFVPRLRRVGAMALPGVALVGGYLLWQRIAFGAWLPISGSVKSFYESQWGGYVGVHGSWWASMGWHFRHVFELAIAPLREDVPAMLAALFDVRSRVFRNVVWAILLIGVVGGVAGSFWRGRSFARVVGVYALLHVALMGTFLPHFTDYGVWYFSTEVVMLWLLLGALFAASRWRLDWLCGALAVLVCVGGCWRSFDIGERAAHDRLRDGGRWLEQNVEPGAVVGTLSSGRVGWYAPSQHVVNLDGLINSPRYFEQFLTKGRLADYFDERGITWFADYQPRAAWQNGVSWQGAIPAERLVPRRYWRMYGDLAYAVWQVLPRDATFELLGDDGPEVRDRYVELGVAADVHGRFRVVEDEHLEAALAADPGLVVARSLVDVELNLAHVLAAKEQLHGIALTEATVHPMRRVDVSPADGVRVIGYDLTELMEGDRRRVAVTLFWRCDEGASADDLWLQARTHGGGEWHRARVGRLHGSLSMREWPRWPGAVGAETVTFDLPRDGELRLSLLDKVTGGLAPFTR